MHPRTERLLRMYLRWKLAPVQCALVLSFGIFSLFGGAVLVGLLWGLLRRIWQ